MKVARKHRVTLSDRALIVLDEARELPHVGNLVIASRKGRVQGQHPMSKMRRKLEIAAVPHAFRSSVRDWANECSEAPREVRDLDLAHIESHRFEPA